MAQHDRRGGLFGILGGLLFLFFSLMHMAAHGLDASPDHNAVLGVSQDAWFALGLLPYPLQFSALLMVRRILGKTSRTAPRVLLWTALLGLCMAAVGHAFLSVPYTGDWRTAPTERIGWPTYLLGNVTFALTVLLGALSLRMTQGGAWRPLALMGASLLSSFPLAMLDADHGFEFTLAPTLLYGLAWVWLGQTFSLSASRRSQPAGAAPHPPA